MSRLALTVSDVQFVTALLSISTFPWLLLASTCVEDELHGDGPMPDDGVLVGCMRDVNPCEGSVHEVEAVDRTTSATTQERTAKGRK